MEEQRHPDSTGDPRVRLAGERTMLAWIRTGLAMMGFGFVVARFGLFLQELAVAGQAPPRTGWSLWIGTSLVLLGVAVNLLAAFEPSITSPAASILFSFILCSADSFRAGGGGVETKRLTVLLTSIRVYGCSVALAIAASTASKGHEPAPAERRGPFL